MASAASLIPELKQGKTLARPGYTSMRDSLWMTQEWEGRPVGGVTYARYFGEDEWSYQAFTLEEIATWTDDGDWEIEDEDTPPGEGA